MLVQAKCDTLRFVPSAVMSGYFLLYLPVATKLESRTEIHRGGARILRRTSLLFFTPPLNFKAGSLCTIGGWKNSHPYPCRRRLPLQPSCNIDRSYRSCLSFNDGKTTHIKHPEKHTNTLTRMPNTKTRLITQTRQATKAEAPGKWMKVELSFVSTAKSNLLLHLPTLLLYPCR